MGVSSVGIKWARMGMISELPAQPAELLPRLHELLNCAGRREVSAGDAAALVGALVEVADVVETQMREALT
jgi:hypothetical protein